MEVAARSLLVMQMLDAHDMATVVVQSNMLPAQLLDGTPVELRWGYDSGHEEQKFYGYVSHLEPWVEPAGVQLTKIVCMGASLPLRQNMRRSWQNQSAETIVREIASIFYLSALAEPHPVVIPFIACTGSVWEFLVELATRSGYFVAANQTEIRFMSMVAAARRSLATAPRLIMGSNLTEFRPLMGRTGGQQTMRVAYGVDPRTGGIFTSTVLPNALLGPDAHKIGFVTTETDIVSNHPGDATAQLEGRRDRNQFAFEATAEAGGNVNLRQGVLVYIDGIKEDYAGYWMTTQVEHSVRGPNYEVFLQLGRDARGAFGEIHTNRPGGSRRADPFGEVLVSSPPTRFLNGNWRSGWARRAV